MNSTVVRIAARQKSAAFVLLALAGAPCVAQVLAQAPMPTAEVSSAERLIFLAPHLRALKPSQALQYQFVRKETGGAGFTDKVDVRLAAGDKRPCCNVEGSFLSGERAFPVPTVADATANPVLLYFLEHEIRQLQRATKGQAAHFQKRIRLALVDGATMSPTTVQWQGREVPATAVRIAPYLDDPYRARFEKEAQKVYTFVISEAVPGQVFQIRAELPGVEETLTLTALEDSHRKK